MKRLISCGVALTILSACTELNAPNTPASVPRNDAVSASRASGGGGIQLVDLGTLPGGSPSFAQGISGRAIVGYSYTAANYSGVQHAVRWLESTPGSGTWVISDLSGQITGSTMSAARATNASGDVVGWMRTSDGADHAFLLSSNGTLTVIGNPAGKNASYAIDINATRAVVGYATSLPDPGGSASRAFYYSGGITVELPTLSGQSQANSIADDGTVVGYSYDASGTQHAVQWTRDSFGTWTIAALAGGANATAEAINTTGNIAGSGCPNLTVNGCSGGARAYVWANGATSPTILGTLGGNVSAAYGINDTGDVAGWSYTKIVQRAFYSASGSGVLTDLGSLAGKSGSSSAAALDGKLVVGSSQVANRSGSVPHATLWVLP
jgi:probable HAF family extracellular repeat protein